MDGGVVGSVGKGGVSIVFPVRWRASKCKGGKREEPEPEPRIAHWHSREGEQESTRLRIAPKHC
jgi:hypothetical protein